IKYGNINYPHVNFIIGDLAQTPFKDHSFKTIINMLSPINYQEVDRLLQDDGILIKIIPNHQYLKQLRLLVNKQASMDDYVYQHLKSKMSIIKEIDLSYDVDLSLSDLPYLYQMSPLTWHLQLNDEVINTITIDLKIIVATKLKQDEEINI
ncbi:MAG: hypothetical protein ACRCTA_06815, partial [Bacilli bacterium]